MTLNLKLREKLCAILIIALFMGFCLSVTAEEQVTNTGQGKPKAMDIYIGEFPYSSSVGGNVTTEERKEVPNEFKVIVDDDKNNDPDWFPNLGQPGVEPTPTAAIEIDIEEDTIGDQLCVQDNTTDVVVDFAFSRAGYKNQFRLHQPRTIELGWTQGDNLSTRQGDAFGTTWNLGTFPAGTELIFADSANGKTYYTGPAERNPDKIAHAAITLKNPDGPHHKYLVSFEDFWNGGDKDYNDVEFYVSGNLSTDNCPLPTTPGGDGGSGGVIPFYVEGTVCKCRSPDYNDPEDDPKGKVTCVAQFTYSSTGDNINIPVKTFGGEAFPPWNEFTGSGMVKQFRCQPSTFYIDAHNAPFWTNRFWNNIKWKLGYEMSVLVKCQKDTPWCDDVAPGGSDAVCNYCADGVTYNP